VPNTLITSVVYSNYEIVKQHLDFLATSSTSADIIILENPSDDTFKIKTHCMNLFKEAKIKSYYLFNENITGNVFKVFYRDYDYSKYEYVVITDGDLTVTDNCWLDEQKRILNNHSDAFACSVDLSLENLPSKQIYSDVDTWHSTPVNIFHDCQEGFTGASLLLFKEPTFRDFMKYLNNNNFDFVDGNMRKYCLNHKMKWLRTKHAKAYHHTWDLYHDPNHPYTIMKVNTKPKDLWHHGRTCEYVINNQTLVIVNVVILTYNQKDYIQQAVESILMQESLYNFNIIIGDDSSTDGTSEIVANLAAKNENIFYYRNPKNLGVTKNLQKAFTFCKGKYVAFCEGDDYWTDKNKITKQVEFLEENLDCSTCIFHHIIYDQNTGKTKQSNASKHDPVKLDTQTVIEGIVSGNFTTIMYRKDYLDLIDPGIFEIFSVDWAFNIAMSEFGLIAYVDENMSVFRAHDASLWNGNKDKKMLFAKSLTEYDDFFKGKYKSSFEKLKAPPPKIITKNKVIHRRAIPIPLKNGITKNKVIHRKAIRENLKLVSQKRVIVPKARRDSIPRVIHTPPKVQPQPVINHTKLNIGCGKVYFPQEWLNIDQLPQPVGVSNYMCLDVIKTFPFKNIELIYSEHFIEHLAKADGISFIRNCFNSLISGGILRIATFDLDELVDNCHSANPDWKEYCMAEEIGLGHMSKCEFLNAAFRNWGHNYVYNREDLMDIFRKGGFTKITECDINVSTHPELCNRETRPNSFLVIEGTK